MLQREKWQACNACHFQTALLFAQLRSGCFALQKIFLPDLMELNQRLA
jgi:hypothetical protein